MEKIKYKMLQVDVFYTWIRAYMFFAYRYKYIFMRHKILYRIYTELFTITALVGWRWQGEVDFTCYFFAFL